MKLIIYPSGEVLDLPGAHYVETGDVIHHFYDKKGEGRIWLYSISAATPFIIDNCAPRQLSAMDKDAALDYVVQHLYEYQDSRYRKSLAYLRSVLWSDFRVRTGWKEIQETDDEGETT